jgi:hypothetical protein
MQIKQLILFFILLICGTSCDYLGKSVPSKEILLQEELKTIDWNQVDQYPSVVECENMEDKSQRQQCFFEYLTEIIQQKISQDTLPFLGTDIDTIIVKVTIFPDATIDFDALFPEDSVAYDKIRIDSLLTQKLKDFPRINPALKRGIPVKTQFILPVILKQE